MSTAIDAVIEMVSLGWSQLRPGGMMMGEGAIFPIGDDQIVVELGRRVDPDKSVIRVDGARVRLDDTLVYLALNKPLGMYSTMSDEKGRPCIGDLVEQAPRLNIADRKSVV